jgi:hypothetical protein
MSQPRPPRRAGATPPPETRTPSAGLAPTLWFRYDC